MARFTLFACAALMALAAPALAGNAVKPESTKPVYIAMLYEKLAGGKRPDFAEWVQHTPEYLKAELYDRPGIVEKNSADLSGTYNLITVTEPIVLEITAHITGYSPSGHGFLVQNFGDMTSFGYEYLGRHYAVIPNGIQSYQWLKAPPTYIKDIMQETDNGHKARLVLTMIPMAADPKPMTMRRRPYNLMMTEISKIELWSKDGSRIVWDDQLNNPTSTRSKVLNLFQ